MNSTVGRNVIRADICWLPARNGDRVPAEVVIVSHTQFRYWHQRVQLPFIRPDEGRLDRYWHWERFARFYRALELTLERTTTNLQILVPDRDGKEFPAAQLLVSDGYPYLPDPQKQCVFIWYLTGAPRAAFEAYGIPDLKTLKPMIDVAIKHSFDLGYEGRVCLHAARHWNWLALWKWRHILKYRRYREADRALCDKYSGAGMLPLPVRSWLDRIIMLGVGRANDGRYFYADERLALDLSKKMDYLRT